MVSQTRLTKVEKCVKYPWFIIEMEEDMEAVEKIRGFVLGLHEATPQTAERAIRAFLIEAQEPRVLSTDVEIRSSEDAALRSKIWIEIVDLNTRIVRLWWGEYSADHIIDCVRAQVAEIMQMLARLDDLDAVGSERK